MRSCTSIQAFVGIAILLLSACDAQISDFIGSPYRTGIESNPPNNDATIPPNSGPPAISQFAITNTSFTNKDLSLNFAGDNVDKWCINVGSGDPSSCTWVSGSLPTTYTLPDTISSSQGSTYDTKGYKTLYAWTQNASGTISTRQSISFNYNPSFPIQSNLVIVGIRNFAFDSSGNVWSLDAGLGDTEYVSRVVKMDSSLGFLSSFGKSGVGNGEFSTPVSISIDSNNNIYVLNQGSNSRIQKFDAQGTYLTRWGSAGAGDGQFSTSYAGAVLALSSGNILLSDPGNSRIQKFTSTGTFLMKWGTSGSGNGQFSFGPCAILPIAEDASGNIYVSDCANHRVQKFDANGNFISSFGSAGNGNGQFYSGRGPGGVSVDSLGNVWVSDPNNRRIQKFDSSGNYLSQFSTGTISIGEIFIGNNKIYAISTNLSNGPRVYDLTGAAQPTVPQFNMGLSGNTNDVKVGDVFVDSSGNLFATDMSNHKVYKFNSLGVLQFQFGSFGAGDGQFNTPNGIATDSLGHIYVADSKNNRLQKFDASGNYVAKVAGISLIEKVEIDANDRIYAVTKEFFPGKIYRYTSFGPTISANGSVDSSGSNVFICAGFDSTGNLITYESTFSDVIQRVIDPNTLAEISNKNVSVPAGLGFSSNLKDCTINRSANIAYFVGSSQKNIGKLNLSSTSISYLKYFAATSYVGGPTYDPQGIGLDASGNIYTAELGRIQKLNPANAAPLKQ